MTYIHLFESRIDMDTGCSDMQLEVPNGQMQTDITQEVKSERYACAYLCASFPSRDVTGRKRAATQIS